jgi:hypothetical protein
LQIPENQLQLLTPHQARVQKSLEKLSLPNWYKPVNSSPANPRFIHILKMCTIRRIISSKLTDIEFAHKTCDIIE